MTPSLPPVKFWLGKLSNWNYLPWILVIFLYILIYFLRLQQGGWDLKIDIWREYRGMLDQRIGRILPSPQAELLSGILLGQNKHLPATLKLALRDTSTLHIVVASGQNLSMVAGFFLALSGLIRRRNAISLSLTAVIFYTLLTGLQVPILRAAVMFVLSALAQLLGRPKEGLRIFIITGALMLLVKPEWIADLSFQLSFLATFGVVFVAPILLKFLPWPIIGQDLAVTLGAQLMVTPIIIQNFHQLSLVSVVTNLLVGWTVPFIMVAGSITLILSLISHSLAGMAGLATAVFLAYFIDIVQFFAGLPFAWEYVGEQVWVVWVGYYMILVGLLLSLAKIKN